MKPVRLAVLFMAFTLLTAEGLHAQSFYQPFNPATQQAGFGRAVAIGAHHVFIGEPQSFSLPGQVHVYQRNLDGQWEALAQLQSPDAHVGDGFGQILATEGSTLLVGHPQAENGQGQVHVYQRNTATGGWDHTGYLPHEQADGANLGAALTLNNGYAYVGAPGVRQGAGAVYVYSQHATGSWEQVTTLLAPEGASGDRFGAAVTADENHILVGAPLHNEQKGAAYLFHTGSWEALTTLTSTDLSAQSRLGTAVTLGDGMAFVSAPRHNRMVGTIVIYTNDGTTWSQQTQLTPENNTERHAFGSAMQYANGTLWSNAPFAGGFVGAIFRYTQQDDGSWQAHPPLTNADGSRAGYGSAFAVRGNLAVIGLSGADYGEGRAHILMESEATWIKEEEVYNALAGYERITGEQINCAEGEADAFGCEQVDLVSFLPLADMDIARGVRLNDVWGWTDPDTGKEYGLIGHMEGTVFIDMSDAYNPIYLGTLPRTEGSPGSTWRDMKTYKNHAYIVADGAGTHGMQVFDLTQLRDVSNPPQTFEATNHYDGIASSHNIVINEESGFAYAVGNSAGGETCGGGLHMIDIRDPANPVFAGCFSHSDTGRSGTGYSHDAQCVIYEGPDTPYQGKEICIGANETAISIADVTDKDNPVSISSGSYPNHAYVHQGWLSEDHRYFYQNDELDELSNKVERTRTLIWDVTDLDDPQMVNEYFGETNSTDHNLYIHGQYMYQTNNASGLRIIDISDPVNPVEVGFFDTTPMGNNVAGFDGTWSSYPYFKSGVIVVTSRREGLFLVKKKQVDI